MTGFVDAVSYLALGHVFIGGRMVAQMSADPPHRWIGVAFGSEAALLFAAMIAAIGYGSDFLKEPERLYALIVLTALAMGIRNATTRKLGVPDLTTTVLTLTVTGLAADSALASGANPGWARRAASVVAMFAGAAIGVCLLRYSAALPLALCGVISSVCAVAAYLRLQTASLIRRTSSPGQS